MGPQIIIRVVRPAPLASGCVRHVSEVLVLYRVALHALGHGGVCSDRHRRCYRAAVRKRSMGRLEVLLLACWRARGARALVNTTRRAARERRSFLRSSSVPRHARFAEFGQLQRCRVARGTTIARIVLRYGE